MLVNLLVDEARALELKQQAREWPSWDLTARQICDLELLLDGGFSPLRGFMTEVDHTSVCREMRLADGTLWPMPITLDVDAATAQGLQAGSALALRDAEGVMLAVLHVEDVYEPDRQAEAAQIFGTTDTGHPGVDHLVRRSNPWYVGGTIEGVARPHHYDFTERRLTPAQLRERFEQRGWDRIVAFQTRNPMHRAHQELTLRAARDADAALLIHPVVGMTKPGDVDHFTRVRCYEALLETYPDHLAELSLLPLAMRMGGPREALWHAIIRKNFGCTHLIVGRDHAGPGSDANGEPFYGPYDAQELLRAHTDELGIEMVPFRMMVYLPDEGRYAPVDEVPEGTETASISGTQLRQKLQTGEEIPEWFTFPAVAAELRRTHPPRAEQGFTVFFTGLSGSGKSTIANVLQTKLLERGGRSITLLDGDLVRKHLSSELGFSKEHRDLNIRRIGFVAAEATKHGGAAICAPIAPYAHTRADVRDMVEAGGGFILVFVDTPLEVCEQRDRKGLYAKARAGIIKEFTGISDPYEAPTDAELTIDTTSCSPEEAAEQVIGYLTAEGYLTA
jgi:sulfate adenylyltransferase